MNSTHKIFHLPDEILLNILDWIQDERIASRCFAVTNKSLACNLLRKFVRIEISLGELLELSEQRRSNLLKRSNNLYLHDNMSTPLNVNITRAYSIQSKRVELLSQLESVHTIKVYQGNETELTPILELLSDKTRLKSLMVKELVLIGGELKEMNVIEGLEVLRIRDFNKLKVKGMHLHTYTSLKTIVLENCKSIVDVSGLDGIYDLTLRKCHNIKDISCLNHNYRITLFDCRGISDLSKSLKESRYITLDHLPLESLPVFPSVKSLSLTELRLQHPLTALSVPKGVKFLSLFGMNTLESIGPNELQKVSILHCKNFNSLENMANIIFIELKALKLTSLSGLGVNNKIVRLRGLKSLEDISVLKDCFSVSIVNCGEKFLEANNNLEHARELTLSLRVLRSIESLIGSNLHLPNLQVLKLIFPFNESNESTFVENLLRRLVERYPTVNKIRINLQCWKSSSVFPPDYLKEMFVVDCSYPGYIILFPK